MRTLLQDTYNITRYYNLHRIVDSNLAALLTTVTLGRSKLKSCWHWLIVSMLLVLNNYTNVDQRTFTDHFCGCVWAIGRLSLCVSVRFSTSPRALGM